MTPVEYIQHLINTYQKAFAQSPAIRFINVNHREGMISAWELALEQFAKVKESEDMPLVEYLKYLVEIYEEAFAENPSKNSGVIDFHEGMIFAWNLAINGLEASD